MDITTSQRPSVIETVTPSVDAGGDQGAGGANLADSFSAILQNNTDSMVQAGALNTLGSIMSKSTQVVEHKEKVEPKADKSVQPEERSSYETDDYADDDVAAPKETHYDDDVDMTDARTDDHHRHEPKDDGARDDAPEQHDTSRQDSDDGEGQSQQQAESGTADGEETVETVSDAQSGTETATDTGALQDVVEEVVTNTQANAQAATVAAAANPEGSKNTQTQTQAAVSQAVQGKTQTGAEQNPAAQVQKAAKPQDVTPQSAQQQTQAGFEQAVVKGEPKDTAAQTQQTQQRPGQSTHILGQNQTEQAAAGAAKGQEAKGQPTQNATVAQQQAQDLAKKLNPGTRMDVNVSVEDEGANLSSRPNTTLAQTAQTTATKPTTPQTQAQQAVSPQMQIQANAQAAAQQQLAQAAQGTAQQQMGQAGQTVNATQATTTQGAGATGMSAVSGAESASSAGSTAQTASQTQQTQQTQDAAKNQAAKPQSHNQRATVDQVSVQITKALKANADTIRIQMKPASLGRVDVHLELSDGKVSATVIADSKDTLDMLQRGSKDLARALNSAGLSADSDSLNYSLREQGGNHKQNTGNGNAGSGEQLDFADQTGEDETGVAAHQQQNIISDERVDIRA